MRKSADMNDSGELHENAFVTGTGFLNVTETPEPTSLTVITLGAMGLLAGGRRQKAALVA